MRSLKSCAVLASSVVIAGGALAGCSGDDDAPSDESNFPPGVSEGVGDQGVVSEDGESVVTSYPTVPPDFPAEVPVLAEDDATGSVTEYDGLTAYSAVVRYDTDARTALRDALALIEEGGADFEGDTAVPDGEGTPDQVTLILDDPELVAFVGATESEGMSLVSYTVEVS